MVGIEGIYLDPVTSISGIRFLQPREQELFLDNKAICFLCDQDGHARGCGLIIGQRRRLMRPASNDLVPQEPQCAENAGVPELGDTAQQSDR